MLYSASTGGFYDPAIHTVIPADAVEISIKEHKALLDGQSTGKRIVADANGRPVLAEQPKPSKADLLARKRAESQAYLTSTDWYLARKVETGAEVPDDVLAKRAEARATLN